MVAVVGSHVRGAPGVTWWWKTSREGGQVGWCWCVPLGSERGDSIRGGGGSSFRFKWGRSCRLQEEGERSHWGLDGGDTRVVREGSWRCSRWGRVGVIPMAGGWGLMLGVSEDGRAGVWVGVFPPAPPACPPPRFSTTCASSFPRAASPSSPAAATHRRPTAPAWSPLAPGTS